MSWYWNQDEEYAPVKAGSIDGTDEVPHDHGIVRAARAYYDASRDPKVRGEPRTTLFFARVGFDTGEDTLHAFFSKYGRVRRLRLVRDIVTGASRGYGFVEYEREAEQRQAFQVAQRALVDGRPLMVDYERERLMPGWVPRRHGGGLGGRKESGQLRFGGRDRPFKKPLIVNGQPAPWAMRMLGPAGGGGRGRGHDVADGSWSDQRRRPEAPGAGGGGWRRGAEEGGDTRWRRAERQGHGPREDQRW